MEIGGRFRPDPTRERVRQARERSTKGKWGIDQEDVGLFVSVVVGGGIARRFLSLSLIQTHKWTSRYTSGRLACVVVVVVVFSEAARWGMKERVRQKRRRKFCFFVRKNSRRWFLNVVFAFYSLSPKNSCPPSSSSSSSSSSLYLRPTTLCLSAAICHSLKSTMNLARKASM